MILPVHAILRQRIADVLTSLYGLPRDAQPALAIEVPPKRALGDLALPFAFELARTLRKAPRVTAQEVAAAIGPLDGVTRVEAAPNGYLNVFLDRAPFLRARLAATTEAAPHGTLLREKTIVEHTAINPNKAAHIGHLRNSTMGDTLVRLLRFSGVPVEVQNYIDDTGVQVADVVVGFQHIEPRSLAEVQELAATTPVRLLLLGSLREGHRVVRGRQVAPRHPRRDVARHRTRGRRRRTNGRVRRRAHRALPPQDDGAPEHRLRPADVGGRHPPAAVLVDRLRDPQAQRQHLPPGRTDR